MSKNWTQTVERYLAEGRTVSGGKHSKEQLELAGDQDRFYDTLRQNYQSQFAGQQDILKALNTQALQTYNKGINQYGFDPAEDQALRSQATEGTGQQAQAARQSLTESAAAVGGGNAFLPSGTKAALIAKNLTPFAQQEAQQQLGITQSGYDLGRQNFMNSAQILNGSAQMMNPLGYANSAQNAGQLALGTENQFQNDRNAAKAQWVGALAGLATSFIPGGQGLSGIASSLGKKVFGSGAGGSVSSDGSDIG